jgi:3-methyladenine DNA glycosylase AlkD
MTNKFLLNDSEHWHARAEEARLFANEMKDSETKDALVRIADSHEHLVQWAENWALRRLPKN